MSDEFSEIEGESQPPVFSDDDLLTRGFQKNVLGGITRKSGFDVGHLRHTSIHYENGFWRVNGMGIAGPEDTEELDLLLMLVFGQRNKA